MPPSELSPNLQKAADYRAVVKSLRTGGIASLVFGALAVVLGLAPPVEWILAALGLALLVTGTWNIAAPRPTGIVVDGVTLLMVGLYNIVMTVVSITTANAGGSHWVVLGIMQLVWGGRRISSYRRFAGAFSAKPSDMTIKLLDQMANEIRRAKPRESPEIIELSVDGFHREVWKAKLSGNDAIFVQVAGHEVVFGTRDSVAVEDRGKVMIGNAVKVTLSVDGHEFKGTMSADAFRRLEEWRTGIVLPKAIAA